MKNKWAKIDCALIGGLLLALAISCLMTFENHCQEIRNQVLRLHIIANSDSVDDQALKLAVRDAVLDATGELFAQATSPHVARATASAQLDTIRQTAQAEIFRQGKNYSVNAYLTNMYFKTRNYGTFTLPAGYYDAIRLTIGQAQGHNWWCVMFPPLCVEAAASIQPELTEKIDTLSKYPDYKLAFAGVELLEKLVAFFNEDTILSSYI